MPQMVGLQQQFSWKTSPDSSTPTVVETSLMCATNWPGAGQWTLHGGLSMPNTGFLSEDVGCLSSPSSHPSLTDVLESAVPRRYFLSTKAALGILRRAERRGRELPPHLQQALTQLVAQPDVT